MFAQRLSRLSVFFIVLTHMIFLPKFASLTHSPFWEIMNNSHGINAARKLHRYWHWYNIVLFSVLILDCKSNMMIFFFFSCKIMTRLWKKKNYNMIIFLYDERGGSFVPKKIRICIHTGNSNSFLNVTQHVFITSASTLFSDVTSSCAPCKLCSNSAHAWRSCNLLCRGTKTHWQSLT